MSRNIRRIWNIFTSVLVVAAVILAVLLVGVRFIGFQVFTVLSSSMEPCYHTGSLIYVRPAEPDEIEPGTPITFMRNADTVVTHRVIEVVQDENQPGVRFFATKGDANDAADGGLVHQNNVIGVPVFSIPYLGYLAAFIQQPSGKYIAAAVCAALLLMAFLPDLFKSRTENRP